MDTASQARALLAALNHPAAQHATEQIESGADSLKLRSVLEKEFPKQVCLDLLDCLSSRHRYKHKFWQVQKWVLSRTAAEQATDSRLARWRSQFLTDLAPDGQLTELGCGLGGDSVFLAQNFALRAYERSPGRVVLAGHNIENLTPSHRAFELHEQDCDIGKLEGDILFCDPARRSQSRLSKPEDWLPPLSQVMATFSQGRFHTVAVKCAPGLQLDHLGSLRGQSSVSFLSICGALKECFVVFNSQLAHTRALLFEQDGEHISFESQGRPIPVQSPKTGLYLHNPDPAILRAEALDSLASQLQGGIVHPKIGYLIGPTPCANTAAQSFEIVEHFRLNWAQLKKRMRAQEWTEFEYLGRGVPFSQSDVRKRLPKLGRSKGQSAKKGSLIIYREESGYAVVLGQRVGKGERTPFA